MGTGRKARDAEELEQAIGLVPALIVPSVGATQQLDVLIGGEVIVEGGHIGHERHAATFGRTGALKWRSAD